MERNLTPITSLKPVLKSSYNAFTNLIWYIRTHYIMDELWDGKEEFKFRKSGKTLVTLYIKNGFFNTMVIFGKAERSNFENVRENFSPYIQNYYDGSKTYHDGKWMLIETKDETYLNEIKELIKIKRKPNRKDKYISENLGRCGNCCDNCLLYKNNNESNNEGSKLFNEMDWACFHTADEERVNYTSTVCPGCKAKSSSDCPSIKCIESKGYNSCIDCNYKNCTALNTHIYEFGVEMCNLGLTAEEVTKAIIPYCGKERFDKQA